MKEVELIIKYYEGLKSKGTELSIKDEEHLAQAYRIFAVATFQSLPDGIEKLDTQDDEPDTFTENEALAAFRWGIISNPTFWD